jgi:hypothetical protein
MTLLVRGHSAHEVQIGPIVIQRFYRRWRGKRWHVWVDRMWRR